MRHIRPIKRHRDLSVTPHYLDWLLSSRQRWSPSLEMSTWVLEYMSTWIHEYMSTWVHKYMSKFVHEYMSTWVHEYINTWVHECMSTWVNEYRSTGVHEYINTLTGTLVVHCRLHPLPVTAGGDHVLESEQNLYL